MADVIVIGETGQVASSFKSLVEADAGGKNRFTFINRSQIDLSKPAEIANFFAAAKKPEVILNLAAYTQVDKAETERETAYTVNALASQEFAKICQRYYYVSTDYVYSGEGTHPYLETDPTAPVNYYGETKLQGELLAQKENPNTYVIRTSWVYSPVGVNFVKRIAELAQTRPQLKVVSDQVGSPTWAPDLAKTLKVMIERGSDIAPGIYNYSNEGVCSWYDFAVATVKASKGKAEVLPISTSEYPTPAKRPSYSVLNKSKIKSALGVDIPHWQESFEKAKIVLFS